MLLRPENVNAKNMIRNTTDKDAISAPLVAKNILYFFAALSADLLIRMVISKYSNENTANTQKIVKAIATLFVRGGDWVDLLEVVQMLVSDSHYTLDSMDAYGDMTELDYMDQIVTSSFDPNNDLPMFWQLVANLLNIIFEGSLVQPIDYTASC